VSGHSSRSPNAALNLVSFIDFLVTTVIFLLSSFSASGEITLDKNVQLPKAENVEDVIVAPMVAVNGSQILVDGVQAGSTRAVEELGRMQKVDELFAPQEQARALEAGAAQQAVPRRLHPPDRSERPRPRREERVPDGGVRGLPERQLHGPQAPQG